MSEPKRYTGKTEGTVLGSPHWEHPEGEWVKWEDYAHLKAEVERLTAFTTRTIIPNEVLQAQVERLTKAGDAMELTLQADFNGCPYEPLIVRNAIIYWRNAKDAAKEGHNMWGIVAPYVVPPCIDRYTAKEGKQP